MPVQDFSYETDVAPYAASRFFTNIQRDTSLSPQARERLQTSFFQDVSGIEAQRMKFEQERTQSALQQAQLAHTQSALEDSRLRRQRIANAEATDSDISNQLNSVVYSGEDPDVRRQWLADLALKHSGQFEYNPTLGHRFKAAEDAIPKSPKPMFTPEQHVSMVSKLADHPQGALILASQDPTLIGVALSQVEQMDEEHKAAKSALAKNTEESRRLRHELLFTDPKFQDDLASQEKDKWLDDGVYSKYKILVESEGNPKEQKAFAAEKDHHKKAEIVMALQRRVLRSMLLPTPAKKGVNVGALVPRVR